MTVRVAPSRRTLACAAGVVAASLAVFVLIAEDLLDGGGLISHDDAVLTWFVDHRSDRLIRAAKLASALGGFVSLLIVGVTLGLWLFWRGSRLGIAAAPAASLLLASVASTIAKALFNRPRPPVTVHAATVTLAAFPSGHATDAAGFLIAASYVLAITVAHRRITKITCFAVGLSGAVIVGLSRLVLGVHWLSDVIAGWALGTAIAVTTVTLSWWGTTRTTQPRPTP